MYYILLCLLVFVGAWCINLMYVSIFYHRGFTHKALRMRPWLQSWVRHSGVWVTGIDPKAWACMHRMHHAESDTEDDPHSPVNLGIIGTFMGQLRSYEKCLVGIMTRRKKYMEGVADLEFPVHWIFRHRMWWAPFLIHLAIAFGIGLGMNAILLAVAYYFGMTSHPVQGWLVNAFGHSKGYRNFDLSDNSRNNTIVALVGFGEGYQNNHHRFPSSPRFSVRSWEIDFGYWVCVFFKWFGLISFERPEKIKLPTLVKTAR